jgi:hypothetical protein
MALGLTTCAKARSKASGLSSTATLRAMSMKRLDCSGSSGLMGDFRDIHFLNSSSTDFAIYTCAIGDIRQI